MLHLSSPAISLAHAAGLTGDFLILIILPYLRQTTDYCADHPLVDWIEQGFVC